MKNKLSVLVHRVTEGLLQSKRTGKLNRNCNLPSYKRTANKVRECVFVPSILLGKYCSFVIYFQSVLQLRKYQMK